MKPVLIMPIGGKSKRFKERGYNQPKSLIPVGASGHIIDWAISSLDLTDYSNVYFIGNESDNIDEILQKKFPGSLVIKEMGEQKGALFACLNAIKQLNITEPIVIFTPDIYFEPKFFVKEIPNDRDGYVLTFKANNPSHSYVKVNQENLVESVAEKVIISNYANIGYYYFRDPAEFVRCAEQMIQEQETVNGEYYIAPIYNRLIKNGRKIGFRNIEKCHVLGTPDELEFFTNHSLRTFYRPWKPIGLCSDHSGFVLKEKVKGLLDKNGTKYFDFGCYTISDCDYSDYVIDTTKAIQTGLCDIGIGFCRTGQGINICANKQNGIFSALIESTHTAGKAIEHNCANFFSIPSVDNREYEVSSIIKVITRATFDGGRHYNRIRKFDV